MFGIDIMCRNFGAIKVLAIRSVFLCLFELGFVEENWMLAIAMEPIQAQRIQGQAFVSSFESESVASEERSR